MPSSDIVEFNVSVPTVISLITQGADVNREEVMVIEGILLDIVENPLANLTVEVWPGGQFMTNVDTDSEGFFSGYPVQEMLIWVQSYLKKIYWKYIFICQVTIVLHGIFSVIYLLVLICRKRCCRSEYIHYGFYCR